MSSKATTKDTAAKERAQRPKKKVDPTHTSLWWFAGAFVMMTGCFYFRHYPLMHPWLITAWIFTCLFTFFLYVRTAVRCNQKVILVRDSGDKEVIPAPAGDFYIAFMLFVGCLVLGWALFATIYACRGIIVPQSSHYTIEGSNGNMVIGYLYVDVSEWSM